MSTVVVSHRCSFPPERVFDAWLDPAVTGRFLFATSNGEMVRAELDPRVGGRFLFTDRRDGVDVDHFGEYIEISRPTGLAFDFWVDDPEGKRTRVTLDFRPTEEGCELTLTHEGVWEEYVQRTTQGWTMILANLEEALS